MTKTEALKALKAAGTAQHRKVYARHGIVRTMFGVSYSDLGKLKKKIKTDHGLAESLWKTGNHDAMVLAAMIADPSEITATTLDAWVKDLDSYPLTDAFAGMVAKSPLASKRAIKWSKSTKEWISSAGWSVVAHLANAREQFSTADLEKLLLDAEQRIHKAPNRTRYAINSAVISIGTTSAKMKTKAVAAAKRIGPVEVDHGETGCKTPNAVTYIPKAFERSEARAQKAKKKRPPRTGSARA